MIVQSDSFMPQFADEEILLLDLFLEWEESIQLCLRLFELCVGLLCSFLDLLEFLPELFELSIGALHKFTQFLFSCYFTSAKY